MLWILTRCPTEPRRSRENDKNEYRLSRDSCIPLIPVAYVKWQFVNGKDLSLYPLLLPQLVSDALQNVPFCSGERGLQGHTLLAPPTPSPPQPYFQPSPSTPAPLSWGNKNTAFRKRDIIVFFLFFCPSFEPFVQISVPGGQTIFGKICQISPTIWRMNFSKAGMNFSNSCVFRIRHHEPHFRSHNVLMKLMCRRKSACVVAKGAGQPGVQSEWVGTTCFRRLVQKDSCFEHDQVRHVLQSACKCSSADYR
jgi:hypothetical protein